MLIINIIGEKNDLDERVQKKFTLEHDWLVGSSVIGIP